MGLFGSRKPIEDENDPRSAERRLRFYLGEGVVKDHPAVAKIIRQMLFEAYAIDPQSPTCGKDEQIGGLLRLAKDSPVFRQAVTHLKQFPACLRETFALTGAQLRYVCLKAGLYEGIKLAARLAPGKGEAAYLGMSADYVSALGVESYEKALDMIVHIDRHDPKAEVDRFLRQQGRGGFQAIAGLIEQRAAEGKIRQGPLKSIYCTIHEGFWLLDQNLSKNPKEMTKSLTWLACSELGVPRALMEDLMIQLEAEA